MVRVVMIVVGTVVAAQCVSVAGQTRSSTETAKYTVTVTPDFTPRPPASESPDISRFTTDSVREAIPSERDGHARIGKASELRLLDEAFRRDRGRDLRQRQASDEPRVILIEDGVISLDQVVRQLGDEQTAQQNEGEVTLRLPLVVQHGATLVVDGRSTSQVRLSTDRGVFLANAGRLFVVDALVTAWSENASQPSVFVSKQEFRPFITSYVRSKTYVAGSKLQHLGFAAPSAYGFSLTSHPDRELGEPRDDWPTGVIVGNEFRGLYYGFYSFEARDVAIVDNLYIGNIVYGIDPHDRSTRLVIAGNTSTGTIERHGIIGSRGISHSFIVDNVTYQNAGSGIMLDRQCTHNLVCGNKVYQNGQGIAVYESPTNVIRDNLIAFNIKSGVRVRNSVDIEVAGNTIVGHGDYALEVYAKQLDDHQKRVDRGDTYDVSVGVSFFGNSVVQNRGLAKASNLGLLQLSDIRRDVDVLAIAAELNVVDYTKQLKDDAGFGQELKPLASRLQRLLSDGGVMLEVKGHSP